MVCSFCSAANALLYASAAEQFFFERHLPESSAAPPFIIRIIGISCRQLRNPHQRKRARERQIPPLRTRGKAAITAKLRAGRLAAHNERRHPAKRARSCASKPHRGFDCFATAQQPGSRALGFVLAHERFASAPLRIQERTHWRLPAADSSADYSSRLKL